MPGQLTQQTANKITQALEDSYFSSAAFHINFPEKGNKYVEIRFKDDTQYFFSMSSSYSKHRVNYSPGSFKLQFEYTFDDFNDIFSQLSAWCQNIQNELIAYSPVYIQLEKFKKEFNEKIESCFEDTNLRFSAEEVEYLKAKLDELTDQISEIHRRNELTEDELNSIKKSLDALKESTENIPKKTWYRAAGNKLGNIVSQFFSSKAGQKLLEEGTEKLLNLP